MADRTFGRVTRFVVGRRRLLLSIVIGVASLLLIPQVVRPVTRLLLAWDISASLYVLATLVMIARSSVESCRSRAALYDEGDWMILILVVGSAAASFGAIFAELGHLTRHKEYPVAGLVVTVLTVVLSWAVTHIVFTLHYANLYYRPDEDGPGGLAFPGNRAPDYRDFLYYSFVIGCANQTGDIATQSSEMRHLTLVHGIVSFAFNTAILALMINVGASLLN